MSILKFKLYMHERVKENKNYLRKSFKVHLETKDFYFLLKKNVVSEPHALAYSGKCVLQ